MDAKKMKTYPIATSSCRRRRRRRRGDHVDDGWRDWAWLPRDVLRIVLGRLPQPDILRGAVLVCSPWRRLALEEEPQLWRHIDLSDGGMPPWRERLPAGWKAMARVAVDRSARRCESFTGYVDADVLVHLANRAPLLRELYVGGWPYIPDAKLITEIVKKLPLLERLVLGSGFFQEELLVALLNRCPRLELLDASYCRPMFRVWQEPIATRIRSSTIKELLLPHDVLL